MSKRQKTLYDLIRVSLKIAANEEARIAPFNLSGRGHEPRVILDKRLAGVLRGTNLPFVYMSGYGANNHYPLRVFERAQQGLSAALKKSPLAIGRERRAYIDDDALPKPKRPSIRIRSTARTSRDELVRRGWGMRGAWAEKSFRGIRMVLSGRVVVDGVEYIGLSFHPWLSLDDALAAAESKLDQLSAPIREKAKPSKPKVATKFLEPNEEYGPGFFASLIDGPAVDLFDIAGLEYSDELHDKVWGRRNWKSLLEECGSATIIETGDQDDAPGMSDIFYWIAVDDEVLFRDELRAAMLED